MIVKGCRETEQNSGGLSTSFWVLWLPYQPLWALVWSLDIERFGQDDLWSTFPIKIADSLVQVKKYWLVSNCMDSCFEKNSSNKIKLITSITLLVHEEKVWLWWSFCYSSLGLSQYVHGRQCFQCHIDCHCRET